MTFWLIRLPENARAHDFITMPEYNNADWSMAKSNAEIRKQLLAMNEALPPETLRLQADLIWLFTHKLAMEDIVVACVPVVGKTEIYFAHIAGNVFYTSGENRVPLKWFDAKARKLQLRRHMADLEDAMEWPQEVSNKALKQTIRNHLPLPGNRFRNWYWLVVIVIIIKAIERLVYYWRS